MQILDTSANWIKKTIMHFFVGNDEDKVRLIWYIRHVLRLTRDNTVMLLFWFSIFIRYS